MTWKPTDHVDEQVRNWMRAKGWEVTATDYHFDQEIYSWRHQQSLGAALGAVLGSSALLPTSLSREVFHVRHPFQWRVLFKALALTATGWARRVATRLRVPLTADPSAGPRSIQSDSTRPSFGQRIG